MPNGSDQLGQLERLAHERVRAGAGSFALGATIGGHRQNWEFGAVRSASIGLFRSFKEDVWPRRGSANQKEVTVRALAFITAGHQMHHRIILEERYFPAIPRA